MLKGYKVKCAKVVLWLGIFPFIIGVGSINASAGPRKIVQDAVAIKGDNINMSTRYIVDKLYKHYKGSKTPFGGIDLTVEEIRVLRKAGFGEDFIRKMGGLPEWVTIGTAGVWLSKANDVVAAAMVRILWPPRGYFFELNKAPWKEFKKEDEVPEGRLYTWWYNLFDITKDRAWINNFDLNVGVTTVSEKEDGNKGKSNFFLVGMSYEIHRGALINGGLAFSTEGKFSESKQGYLGFTLDTNFLKALNIITK